MANTRKHKRRKQRNTKKHDAKKHTAKKPAATKQEAKKHEAKKHEAQEHDPQKHEAKEDDDKKREAKKVLAKHLMPVLQSSLASSSANDFYHMIVEQFLVEKALEEKLLCALMEQLIDPTKKIFEPKRLSYEDSSSVVLSNLYDLSMLEDSDFWTYFHMTRRTVKMVLRDVKELCKQNNVYKHKLPFNVPFETVVALPIWYLSSDKYDLEVAIQIFNLNSIEEVEATLEYGLQVISSLKRQSRLVWPTEDELQQTADCMQQRFKFENIMGALTYKVFTSKKGERILLMAVTNEKYMYKYAEISHNINIRTAFRTAPSLMNLIENLPDKYCILGDVAYNTCDFWKSINRVITPIEEAEMGEYDKQAVQIFNALQESAMSIATGSLDETVRRFPRLLALPKSIPEAVIAACVLNNYCIFYRDETPFVV